MMKYILILFLLFNFLFAHGDQKSISHETFNKIKEIEELTNKNQITKALKQLEKLEKALFARRANNYEKAVVERFKGYVYISNNEYKKAVNIFVKLYKEKNLKADEYTKLPFHIAQLYMAQERYFSAIKYFKKAYNNDRKNLSIVESLSYAYNNLEYPNKAIFWIKKAIDLNPKKSSLEFLKALYFNEKQYTKAIDTQKQIFKLHGLDKKGLFFITALYQEQGDKKNALHSIQLAYDMNYFDKEEHYLSLSFLLQDKKLYYQSASILKEGIDKKIVKKNIENLRFLYGSYLEAKEYKKAINTLEKLTKLEDKANVYMELAQVYMEDDNYKNAILNFNTALKLKTKKESSAYLLLGISYYELKEYSNAKNSFEKALMGEKKKEAKQWLEYLNSNQ